jgi:UDP-N-acetylglucosamine 2-epimerase (non-hydrolysing)/GDP/UDP-N,N'-diacetylbacillosamine 2-epimerase (hydrolysing)
MMRIRDNPKLRLRIIATGTHLLPEFGKTINTLTADGLRPDATVAMYSEPGQKRGRTETFHYDSLARGVKGVGKVLKRFKPKFLVILGDRIEPLAGALAAVTLSVPIAHIHGGDSAASGHIDESLRHAITRLAHIHFVASERSAERLKKSGEEEWRIHIVGSPYTDSILAEKLLSEREIRVNLGLSPDAPILVCIQHPTMLLYRRSREFMLETLSAVREFCREGFQAVVIYPNNDTGCEGIIEAIEEARQEQNMKIVKSLPHAEFLSLLRAASVLVGNSSCAFMEAHYFGLPAVNIGERNRDREKRSLVFDCDYSRAEIAQSIRKAYKARQTVSPGGGEAAGENFCSLPSTAGASEAIVKILLETRVTKRLLAKKFLL